MRNKENVNLNTETEEIIEKVNDIGEQYLAEIPVTGCVINCEGVRVRKTPVIDPSNIITTIMKNSEVQIHLNESTENYYKVVTASGAEGYCMKKFIEIRL